MFLHIMIEDNSSNKYKRNYFFLCMSWWIELHLFEKYPCNHVLKNENLFQGFEIIFMKTCSIYFTCDSTYFEPCL
jgi:hypothetical protein